MTENLFGAITPSVNNNADGSTNYTLGTRFTPAVNGNITHGRWYFPTTIPHPTTPIRIGIFNAAGTLLGFADFPLGATLGAWNQVAFSPAIPVTAGLQYKVAYYTPLRYVATPNSTWPVVSSGGNLTADAANGWIAANPGALANPTTQSGNAANYFADVVFEPAAGGGTPFTRDYSTSWNIRNAITRDYSSTWNIRNAFAARDYSTTWAIRNAFAARDYSTTWNIRNALTRDYATSWNIRNAFISDYATSWNISSAFIRDYAFTWSIRNAFAQDYTTQWAIRNAFTRDYATAWNILADTSFIRDYATSWNIRNGFQRDYLTRWNILSDTPTPPLPANVRAYLDDYAAANLEPTRITAWL